MSQEENVCAFRNGSFWVGELILPDPKLITQGE